MVTIEQQQLRELKLEAERVKKRPAVKQGVMEQREEERLTLKAKGVSLSKAVEITQATVR